MATFDETAGRWIVDPTQYDTAGAMHLSNELLWHHHAVNGFPGETIQPPPDTTPGDGVPTDGPSTSFVSYGRDIQPIFSAHCSCHLSARGPQGLSLTTSASYGNLFNRNSTEEPNLLRVAPGDPDASFLLRKLGGVPGATFTGERMPRGGAKLSDSQLELIRTWILEGAADH